MPANNVKVALYCRVAHESQEAIDSQRESLTRFAEEQGFKNPVHYIDNGFSGYSGDRPAFAQLNADIEAGNVRAVIAKSIDRLWRNTFEAYSWCRLVEAKGISILLADDSAPPLIPPQELKAAIQAHYRKQRQAHKEKRSSPKATPNPYSF